METKVDCTENKGAIIYRVKSSVGDDFDKPNCVLFEEMQDADIVNRTYIQFPYKTNDLIYQYGDSPIFDRVKELWETVALDRIHPTASVAMMNDKIISEAGNGKFYETIETCERKRLNVPTGTRYDLCKGNHDFPNHSERKVSERIISEHLNPNNVPLTMYLYGHWWCCEPCCDAMKKAGVKNVVISKSWTKDFLDL